MNYKITVTGGDEMVRALSMINMQVPNAIEFALDLAAEAVKEDIKSLVPVGQYGGGRLKDSIEVIESTTGMRRIGPGGQSGDRSNPLPPIYAQYVETGSPAHFPNARDNSDLTMRLGGDKRLAYAVAKSIAMRGGNAQLIFARSVLMAEYTMRDTCLRAVEAVVNM